MTTSPALAPPQLHQRHLRHWRGLLPRALRTAVVALCAVGLFLAYLRMSRTMWVNSDGSSNALQAWDLLHGNLLLSGWTLTDVTFYTIELPIYALVEAAHGLDADTVHVAAALIYTAVLLTACWLAKAGARGWEAVGRVGIVLFILVAPRPGTATGVLLLSPDHFGTSLALLLLFRLLDRRGPGQLDPLWLCLGLAWTIVSDATALYLGVVPIVLGYGVRALRARAWLGPDARLAYAAALAYPLARLAELALRAAGGYQASKPSTALAPVGSWASGALKSAQSFLLLYGIDVHAPTPVTGWTVAGWVARSAGICLVLWALWRLARGVRGMRPVDAVLALALLINLLAFAVSVMAGTGVLAREVSDTLPLGAVLAGRLIGPRLGAPRFTPALLAGAVAYVVILGNALIQPVTAPGRADLAAWLGQHGLRYGLARYWDASVMTLESGGAVQVRPIDLSGTRPTPPVWDYAASWYDAGAADARFLVVDPYDPQGVTEADAKRVFGNPAAEYQVFGRVVLVYRSNLLDLVDGPGSGH